MELRVLRYFLAVAREGTITRAAEALHVTQPTLSKQLADLERELGCTLLERGKRATTLTDEGRVFAERARTIVDLADKAEAEFSGAGPTALSGDVYLGCGETRAMECIAGAARTLRERHLGVRVNMVSGDAEDILGRLDQGRFDFAVLCGTLGMERYDHLRLPSADVWGVLMPDSAPLARKGSVTADDLAGLPLIYPRQTAERGELSGWLGCDLSKLDVAMTYSLLWNAAVMVRAGLGYAIGFEGLVDVSEGSGLAFRPLEPRVEAPAHLVWKKRATLSRPAQAFLGSVRGQL